MNNDLIYNIYPKMPVQTRSQTRNQREKVVEKPVEKPVEKVVEKPVEKYLKNDIMNNYDENKHIIESAKNFITTLKTLTETYNTISKDDNLTMCPDIIPFAIIEVFEYINNHKPELDIVKDKLKNAIFRSVMRIDDEIVNMYTNNYSSSPVHSSEVINKLRDIIQITKSIYL